jgi:hypothetical protein
VNIIDAIGHKVSSKILSRKKIAVKDIPIWGE